MQDLRLWKLLNKHSSSFEDPLSPDSVVPLLHELAREPLQQRFFLFGLADRLLDHADPRVRAATLGVLGGAHGMPAWPVLLRALNDPASEVMEAALDALKRSASFDKARWLHAFFHHDPAVRAQARSMEAPFGFRDFFPPPENFVGKEEASTPPLPAFPWVDPTTESDKAEIQRILGTASLLPEDKKILDAFLERGTEVPWGQRVGPAEFLSRYGHADAVFPILLLAYSPELAYVASDLLEIAAKGITMVGGIEEETAFRNAIYNRAWVDDDQKALAVLLTQATDIETRYWTRDRMVASTMQQNLKLARLTRAFAWGVQISRYLTGQNYQIEMIVNDYELGYTRLQQNRLYITPLPILRGERNGIQVVRGLILHEIGHHLYHRGPEADTVWQQGQNEGLGRLLNLVTDEHLERNLRHRSPLFGNLLKTLNAYAFQHSLREVEPYGLLQQLGPRADAVLTRVRLVAARKWGHIGVNSGRILREMEESGLSFARFMRALRMGLGNRTGDPKVAEALALFRGGFRKSTMPELLEIARKLREIFGNETDLLNNFGMERVMTGSEEEWLGAGPGLNPEDVRQGVESLLNQKDNDDSKKANRGPGSSRGMNKGPHEDFNRIKQVQKVPHNPAEHGKYAQKVARQARLLRQYFKDLGLGMKPERGRMQGRHFDRTRTRDLILKGDPRFLISRKMERNTDLFLGVVIDCSGSMAGESMEKAKLFGTLLAEALNGQAGVDLRLFGFTDRMLYDAGSARRCAVHGLYAHDGNNDAAALWHVYQVARASKRKAKLLVMISDGLPTECTVNALKSLVNRLTRWHYCCAQVAVLPLDQICFPHYILLQDKEMSLSVRKFGDVIMRLVKQTLGLK